MDELERLELVEELLDEIREHAESGALIIVEGRRDRNTLNRLGIEGEILLATHMPLLDLADGIASEHREVVMLTDWDRGGNELAARISRHLRSQGIMPNVELRGRLRTLVQKKVKDVEGLYTYITNQRLMLRGVDVMWS